MDQLGTLLAGARTRLALSQGAVARLLDASQQAVSRWEKGLSRPSEAMTAKLAGVLNLPLNDIDAALSASVKSAKDGERLEPDPQSAPVRPLIPVLPFNLLGPEEFERFTAELVEALYPDAEVSQLGGRGDDQRGYDILSVEVDGHRIGVQCKREDSFGPAKVAKAVRVAELDVDQSVIALSRTATAEARFEIDKHAGWRLWDQADLSRKIRRLPLEVSLQLVRAHFPRHVEDFLGIKPANPWMTAEEFYRKSVNTVLDHRQALVGRQSQVAKIAEWAVGQTSSDIGVLVGRGGLGKSKLLWEISTRPYDVDAHFRFLAVGQQPAPTDFDILPRSGQLVVVLDDAHGIDHVGGIIGQLRQQRPGSRVILATRPYGETQLDTEVWRLNQSPRSNERWEIDDLSQSEAVAFVSNLIGRSAIDPFTRQLASISADCPFLAVVAADLLRRGELSARSLASESSLRDEVFRRFADQMTGGRTGSDAKERRNVLAAIAAFQPVRLDDSTFMAALTAMTGIDSWDEVNGRIHELEDAGLVLRRGTDAVRVVPDMFGDVLLEQAAYDDRSRRSTLFMARAQAAAGTGAALHHLLVNASRMDWQIRDGGPAPADIVGSLWSTMREELLGGTLDEQLSLLKLLARIAYYQPGRALDLIDDVLGLAGVELPATDTGGIAWASTRMDVVHATAPVLRSVAYHFDHLRPALDVLWSLAQDDDRAPHQHPDHPLRVLTQIADLGTGKPYGYLNAVIDAASDWLSTPTRLSPFDVIEPILAVEGSYETSSELALTFHSFGIDPVSVRPVRQRVVDLAFDQALSNDVAAAVRAVKTLENAIRRPIGMFGRAPTQDEQEAWAREFIPIIQRLGELGTDSARDPAIRVVLRSALVWHAEHSPTATKRVAQVALASLVNTIEDDLALYLHDGWGRMVTHSGLDYQEAERAQVGEFRRVAQAISVDQSDQKILDRLEHRLFLEHANSERLDGASPFLQDFFNFKPSAAAALCEGVQEGQFPELRQFVASALGALANGLDERAVGFATALLAGTDTRLQNAAAFALSWNRGGRTSFLPREFEVLSTMATHDNAIVRGAAGRAVSRIAQTDKGIALDLLKQIRFDRSAKVAADALSSLTAQGPLSWTDTTAAFRESVHAQLVECTSIDEYELTNAISALSALDPLGVTQLLMARVDRRAAIEDLVYEALPYEWDPPLRIQQTNQLSRCLSEVREWMTRRGPDRSTYHLQDDGSTVYKMVAGGWSEQAFSTLGHFDGSSTEAALVTIARILAQAPTASLLKQVPLVTKVLRRAQALGSESGEFLLRALLPSDYGVFTIWSGERPTKDVEELEEARKIATKLPLGSVESRFFYALAESIESRLNWTMEPPRAQSDGRDW